MTAAWKTLFLAACAVAATCAPAAVAPSPILLWNTTSSAPVGLYLVRKPGAPRVGQLVAARPPDRWAAWMDLRGYLPRGVPLVKTIEAVSGQLVCRHEDEVTVDGRLLVSARRLDRLGRPLPVWTGCRRLGGDELLLLNIAAPHSLDGRYFGVSRRGNVIGGLQPIWTRGG